MLLVTFWTKRLAIADKVVHQEAIVLEQKKITGMRKFLTPVKFSKYLINFEIKMELNKKTKTFCSDDIDITNLSTINIFFKDLSFIKYKRDPTMTWDVLFCKIIRYQIIIIYLNIILKYFSILWRNFWAMPWRFRNKSCRTSLLLYNSPSLLLSP